MAACVAVVVRRLCTARSTNDAPDNYLSLPSVREVQLRRWVAGDFVDDWPPKAPLPATLKDVPLNGQPAMLDKAALHYCLADAFHPGCEMTWPLRHASMYEAPFRLAGLFGSATFEGPLMSFDACGARLDPVCGDGWIACGDAALSFDPVAGQGILQALHSGIGAARAVHAALDGDPAELARYRTRLDQIRRVYVDRRRAAYRDEARWPDAPFWAAMQRDRRVLHDPAAVPGRHDAQAKPVRSASY